MHQMQEAFMSKGNIISTEMQQAFASLTAINTGNGTNHDHFLPIQLRTPPSSEYVRSEPLVLAEQAAPLLDTPNSKLFGTGTPHQTSKTEALPHHSPQARQYNAVLHPKFSNIPPELTQRARWLVWRDAKVPYCATVPAMHASSTSPDTWASFEQAKTTYEEGGFSGIGFVLNNDGIMGIDLDKCVRNGIPDPAAAQILDSLQCSYVEISPSGSGLRAFGFGSLPKGVRGKLNGVNIELYSTARYLTVTGHTIKTGPLTNVSGLPSLVEAILANPTEEIQKNTEDNSGHLPSSSVGLPIQRFTPKSEGERNSCLFELARYVKGVQPNASKEELRKIVLQWHSAALPVIRTKDFGISWVDFMHGYERVKFPFGETLKQIIGNIDLDSATPNSLKAFGYGEKNNLLIKICRQLQLKAGNEPFFLSSRQAGDLLGMHFTEAAKCLKALQIDGVLELTSKGAGLKASRYLYIWPE